MCLWNTKIQIKSTERAQFLIDHFLSLLLLLFCFSGTSWSSFRCLRETPVLIPDAPRNSFTVHRRCVQLQVSPIWQKHHEVVVVVVVVSITWHDFCWENVSCQTVMRLKALSPLTFRWSVVSTKKACCLSDSLSRASDLSGQKDSRILSRSSERLFFRSGVTLHLWKISR